MIRHTTIRAAARRINMRIRHARAEGSPATSVDLAYLTREEQLHLLELTRQTWCPFYLAGSTLAIWWRNA